MRIIETNRAFVVEKIGKSGFDLWNGSFSGYRAYLGSMLGAAESAASVLPSPNRPTLFPAEKTKKNRCISEIKGIKSGW